MPKYRACTNMHKPRKFIIIFGRSWEEGRSTHLVTWTKKIAELREPVRLQFYNTYPGAEKHRTALPVSLVLPCI